MAKKVEISKDGYASLLETILVNINEERNLALDRYRIQDEQIESMEDFVLQGKDVVAFLKLASERTNALFAISKEIKDITYANEVNQSTVNVKTSDDERKRLEEIARNLKESKKTIQDIKDEPTEESPE
jgi:hypothetical protein